MNDLNVLSEVFNKVKDYIEEINDKSKPVVKYRQPEELREIINFSIEKAGVSETEFLGLIDQYLDYSVKTGNKQFLNQLYSGFNFPAFIGEIFTSLASTSMATFEAAPVATLIEAEMIELLNSYVGYKNGDGIFLTGGSNANLIAMFSARNKLIPTSRLQGYNNSLKLTAFVNEKAHYSFDTAANVIGIGSKNVIKVKADENGKLITEDLEKEINNSIARGERPFFVAATCGTTLLGSYDPIVEMAEICEKYNLWFHVDGAFGGSVLLSDDNRYLMDGAEKSDSLTWDPHKLMNIPLISSVLLLKEKGILKNNITDIDSAYLYHNLDETDDLGEKSIQCARRPDAVKLWFAWKYFGKDAYENRIDNLISIAKYAEQKVIKNFHLELLVPRQSFTVCFRYIPATGINIDDFNLMLRESLRKSGKAFVNFGKIGNDLCIRLVFINGELDYSDIDLFFKYLIEEANNLEAKKVLKYA